MIFSGLIPVETRSPDEAEIKPLQFFCRGFIHEARFLCKSQTNHSIKSNSHNRLLFFKNNGKSNFTKIICVNLSADREILINQLYQRSIF